MFDKKNNIIPNKQNVSSNKIKHESIRPKNINKFDIKKPNKNDNFIKNMTPKITKKYNNINVSQTKKNLKKSANKSKRIDDFFKKPKKLTPRTDSIKKKRFYLYCQI